MRYVGLDAHLRQSTFCVLDDRGRKIMTRTIKGPWAAVLSELARLPPPVAVCFEASCGYGALFEGLRKIARRIVVAHPGREEHAGKTASRSVVGSRPSTKFS